MPSANAEFNLEGTCDLQNGRDENRDFRDPVPLSLHWSHFVPPVRTT